LQTRHHLVFLIDFLITLPLLNTRLALISFLYTYRVSESDCLREKRRQDSNLPPAPLSSPDGRTAESGKTEKNSKVVLKKHFLFEFFLVAQVFY
jgi:hypothetical protein